MTRLRSIPIGLLAIALVAIPHLIKILLRWHDLPLAPGEVIGSPDPDPWLRLSLVRDWLNGGSWYSHLMTQSNAPWGGISSPWTRPLDILIAGLVKLQPSDVDLNIRLIRAAMLVPWVGMLALVAGSVRAARILSPVPATQLMVVALLGSAPLMWNYFSFAYADHHSLLAALFVWAMGGVFTPKPSRRLMAGTGILLGLMLWISPEALVLIGVIYLWYGLCWLVGEKQALPALSTLAMSAALTTSLAVAIELPPAAWLTPIYDSVSVVYAFILGTTAIAIQVLNTFSPLSLRGKLFSATCACLLLAGGLWLTYPLALRGPMAEVHPYIFSDFLPSITEAQPLFKKSTALVISLLMHPAAALLLCLLALVRGDTILNKRNAAMLGFFVAASLALFLGQVRWNYYCYPLVALALAPWLGALFSPNHPTLTSKWPAAWLAKLEDNQQTLRRMPILLAVFTLPLVAAYFTPEKNDTARKRFDNCAETVRYMTQSGQLSDLLGNKPRVLFTHTNFGAEITFFTTLRIIASNYHREGAGIEYLWESYRITEMNRLRKTLKARGVEALLLCPDTSNSIGSALELLAHGATPPHWLKRISFTPPTPKKKADAESDTPIIAPILLRVMPTATGD